MTESEKQEIREDATRIMAPYFEKLEELVDTIVATHSRLAVISALPTKCVEAGLPWKQCEKLMLVEKAKI